MSLTDHREYIIQKVFTKLGMHKELTKRWKILNYNPPKGGWQMKIW